MIMGAKPVKGSPPAERKTSTPFNFEQNDKQI